MRNWADLPPEIIAFIASKELETDAIRQVCKSWYRAVAPTYSMPICLMNYCRPTKSWRFHRLGTSLFMSFPKQKDAEIRCSKYGWLLMARSDTLFFFNPCSNWTIYLHPRIGRDYTTLSFIHPPTSPDCTVVGVDQTLTRFEGLGICVLKHCGEHEWDIKEYLIHGTRFSLSSQVAPVWHRGRIYFLDVKGNVVMFDITNRILVASDRCLGRQLDDDQIRESYLFKLGGEVFAAFVFQDEVKGVNVFRLSTRKRKKARMKMKWEAVEDIGDNVVCLSRVSSLSFGCSSSADTNTMANRIYFPRLHGGSAVFYSLSDAKYHSHNGGVYSDKNDADIGPDELWDNAAWVTPAAAAAQLTTQNTS